MSEGGWEGLKRERERDREGGGWEGERERIQNFIQLRPRLHMKDSGQQYSYTNILHITKWNNYKRNMFVS